MRALAHIERASSVVVSVLFAVAATSCSGAKSKLSVATTVAQHAPSSATTTTEPSEGERYVRAIEQSYSAFETTVVNAFPPCLGLPANTTSCRPAVVATIPATQGLIDRLAQSPPPAALAAAADALVGALRRYITANQQLLTLLDKNDLADFTSARSAVITAKDNACDPLAAIQAASSDITLVRHWCNSGA